MKKKRTKIKYNRKYSTDGEGITRWYAKMLWDEPEKWFTKKEMKDSARERFENPKGSDLTETNLNFAFVWVEKWGAAIKDKNGRYKCSLSVDGLLKTMSHWPKASR